jgi:O-antigen/teichoic acid export membrane protein
MSGPVLARWRAILRNLGFVTSGKIAGDLCTFVFFVVLSRHYGQEGLGQYSLAMALTGFLLVLAEFGLGALSIQQLSRHPRTFRDFFGDMIVLRLILASASLLLLLLALPWLPASGEAGRILLLIGLYHALLPLADGYAGAFVAREQMHGAALLHFSLRAVSAAAGSAVALAGGSLALAVAMLPLATALHALAGHLWVARRWGAPSLRIRPAALARSLREASPYALSGLLFQLSARVDIVLLGLLVGAAAAGLYNAAYRIVFLPMFLAHLASLAVFPMASRFFVESRPQLSPLYQEVVRAVTLAAVPAAAGLWVIAPALIRALYGPDFVESVPILRLLAPLVLLSALKSAMEVFMMSSEMQRVRASVQAKAALLSGAGNLIVIPLFWGAGAALMALVAELLLVTLLARRLAPVVGWPRIGSRLLMAAAAALAFSVPLARWPSLGLVFAVPFAVVVYVGVLLLFRAIREREGRAALALLRQRSTV